MGRQPWRLILHGPCGPAWNMAVDEALLESAAAGERGTLRMYQWCRPTVSLGYFQSARQPQLESLRKQDRVALVRRLTGGGAIVHHHEWTYSLTLPAGHPLARQHQALYARVHQGWVEVLQELGIAARVVEQPPSGPEPEPFLCFLRRSPGDVVAPGPHGTVKLAGSAQRRRRGGLLQHGSLLLEKPAWPQHPVGLAELLGRKVDAQALLRDWLRRIEALLEAQLVPGQLTAEEKKQALRLLAARYIQPQWTLRRKR